VADDPEDLRVLTWLLRGLRNLPQREMAAAARMDGSVLSRYETGHMVPRRANLERLAAVAGVPKPLLDAVLLPALRATRLAKARPAVLEGGSPAAEAAADGLTGEVAAAVEAAVASFAAELDAAEGAAEGAAGPDAEERVRQTDRAAVERLCTESARAAAGDAGEALELAGLALRIAEASPGEPAWRAGLRSRALAYHANARRVGADLDGAEAAFAEARRVRGESGAWGPELLPDWQLLDLEASLLRERRRFGEALEMLDQARGAAPPEQAAHVLLNKASTLEQAGELEAALVALREAAPLALAAGDPRVSWGIRFNLATNLCHLGRYGEAEELLPEIRAMAAGLGYDLDQVRVVWLAGRIAAGRGRKEEAREAFDGARREFARRRNGYDAALVALELAAMELEAGRTSEVRALAEEMVWILRSHGLGREALAALGLFCQAAAAERATPGMAWRAVAVLERVGREGRARAGEG
jgi:tetratricopeptide (TPR) repeat protein